MNSRPSRNPTSGKQTDGYVDPSEFITGSYYVIAYVAADGTRSKRVVRYEGPDQPMWDCGKNALRDFQPDRIKRAKKIAYADVDAHVRRHYTTRTPGAT